MTLDFPNLNPAALVDVNFVRIARRMDADKITALAESGRLLWVFDVSTRERGRARAACRELRFWLPEIVTPQLCARLTLREVIDRILPPLRRFFRSGDICQLLLITRPTLARIARQMGAILRNGGFQVTRQALVEWLSARWIGGLPA